MNDSVKKYAKLIFYLMLGNSLIAFAVCAFVIPNQFMMGGTTGIALALQHLIPLRLSLISGFIFVSLFFLGLIFMGRQFAAASLFSSFFFPFILGVMEQFPLAGLFMQDRTIAAVFSALFFGTGIGLIIRAGGSSGGMDIPPCILQKYKNIPVGNSMFVFDALAILGQMYFQGCSQLLYSLAILGTTSIVVNRVVIWGEENIQMVIISDKWDEIRQEILFKANCGVSLLHLNGGYSGDRRQAVLSVVYAKIYPTVKDMILKIDPKAFVITSSVVGVNGQGYSYARWDGSRQLG